MGGAASKKYHAATPTSAAANAASPATNQIGGTAAAPPHVAKRSSAEKTPEVARVSKDAVPTHEPELERPAAAPEQKVEPPPERRPSTTLPHPNALTSASSVAARTSASAAVEAPSAAAAAQVPPDVTPAEVPEAAAAVPAVPADASALQHSEGPAAVDTEAPAAIAPEEPESSAVVVAAEPPPEKEAAVAAAVGAPPPTVQTSWPDDGPVDVREIDEAAEAGPKASELTLVHFNDVYNITDGQREPIGGAARFKTALENVRRECEAAGKMPPLVLFSGDAFAPSIMSTVVKGRQMPPVLSQLGIHTAVYGNHDFDFGLEKLAELKAGTNFPWLLSNVLDKKLGRPLGGGINSRLFTWGGRRVGLMGIIEGEWLDTLAMIERDEVIYTDSCARAAEMAQWLRDEGAETVIALTHMRKPNDMKLLQEVPGVDIVLGGHDHFYDVDGVDGRLVFNSGTDFRDLTVITLAFPATNTDGAAAGPARVTDHRHVSITGALAPDPDVLRVVDEFRAVAETEMDTVLGESGIDLDARFEAIRTSETNAGNFVADVMREVCKADVCLLNSGTLRSDTVHPAGLFKMRDMLALLPMADEVCIIDMAGRQLLRALENGVSMYPRLEGRFLQISGISFSFDPSKPSGARVPEGSVRVGGVDLNMDGQYKVCIKEYLYSGKDGFEVFAECPVLTHGEDLPPIPTMVRNFFVVLDHANGVKTRNDACIRKKSRRISEMVAMSGAGDAVPPSRKESASAAPAADGGGGGGRRKSSLSRSASMRVGSEGASLLKIHPVVEGRCICVKSEGADAQ